MVINTGTCSFSDMKVWPGRGSRFITKDGKIQLFIGSKVRSLYHQRIKPVKLTWTQDWRRLNKKGRAEAVKKRRVRRVVRTQKAYVGATLDDIKKRRDEKPEVRQQMREQALREIKERQKKKATQAQKFDKAQSKAAPKVSKAKGKQKNK
jgi:large subunit ribosomal protein L24e